VERSGSLSLNQVFVGGSHVPLLGIDWNRRPSSPAVHSFHTGCSMKEQRDGSDRPEAGQTVTILADVVKMRISSEEQVERGVRTTQLKRVKSCRVKLTSQRISHLDDAWLLEFVFRVSISYVDQRGAVRSAERTLTFEKQVPMPPDRQGAPLIPKAKISHLTCATFPLLKQGVDAVLAVVRFDLTFLCVAREEVALLKPRTDS
jgi:hypothetical protein